MLRDIKFTIATNGSGAYSSTGAAVRGKLYAIEVVLGTLASGAADVTISVTNTPSAVDKTLLTLTNISANGLYYVRDLQHGETGSALTGTAGGDRTLPLVCGNLKVVVAQGGDTKAGAVIVYVEE